MDEAGSSLNVLRLVCKSWNRAATAVVDAKLQSFEGDDAAVDRARFAMELAMCEAVTAPMPLCVMIAQDHAGFHAPVKRAMAFAGEDYSAARRTFPQYDDAYERRLKQGRFIHDVRVAYSSSSSSSYE